ncbi:MAG: hypothetical protein ACTSRU_13230 [Candidatus Hodarchaeales archaeon]
MVLVDQRMLDNELGVASGNLKYLSQSYSVSGVESKGAFHPKINFLIGDNQLILFFGSGNITPGGHGKNHELFTGFYADKENQVQLPLILEAWTYLLSVADQIEGYNKDRLFRVLPRTSSLFGNQVTSRHEFYRLDQEMEVALLYHDESTIFQQIVGLIPHNEVTQITVISPYFDEDGAALLNLKNQFNQAKIDVYLPSKYGLPPNKIKNDPSIAFFDWDRTKRGKQSISSAEDYYRKLHSKIIHFQAGDYEYCMIGSSNATEAGLGSESGNTVNEEFCALYKIAGNGLLQELGITGKKKSISVSKLVRNDSQITDPDKPVQSKKARILCADLNGRRLQLKYHDAAELINHLAICESNGSRLYRELFIASETQSSSLSLSDSILNQNPSYVVFESETGDEISNKQLINFIDKLYHTDPSRGNRTIRQVLTSLEGGTINEFEIIEFINDLNKSRESSSRSRTLQGKSSSGNEDDDEISAAEMTYDEAVEAAKDQQRSEVIVRGHSSTRLWETISRLFQEKHTSMGEELMDEEEEGSAERSRDRNEADQDQDKVVVKTIDHFLRMIKSVTKLADNYIGQLNRICFKTDHQIDELDLGNFLLVTHILTVVCNFKEYEFAKDEDAESHLKELEQLYTGKMLKILEHFTKLLIKLPFVRYRENDYQKQKFDEFLPKVGYHFWLYVYQIQRKSWHQVIRDKAELVALNFLHFVDEPDKGFDQYLKTLSAAYNDLYFNPLSVVRYSNQILGSYFKPDGQYIGIDHSGICRIISDNGKEIEYHSLFARSRISHSKYKKHKIL